RHMASTPPLSRIVSRESRLRRRHKGLPTPVNFTLAQIERSPPQDGQALVRNLYMSVDPYMRGRMIDRRSYVPHFELGQVMEGGAVGEVVQSRAPGLQEGAVVLSNLGWR